MKKYLIFDMDGTLVDSMRVWHGLALEYLEKRGIHPIPEGMDKLVEELSAKELAEVFIRKFGFTESPEEIGAQILALMEEHYREDIQFKDGVWDCLTKWKEEGARMCVFSMTPKHMMEACLDRLGVTDLVEFTLSCREIGIFKEDPEAYHAVANLLGAKPEETAVFEDALYAAKTAKEAGYYVVGIYDKDAEEEWEELQKIAHEAHISWKEML